MAQYVIYRRVSTDKQQHGIEAQERAIQNYLASEGGEAIATYTDFESGKLNTRANLEKAIQHARKAKATLLVAKLDRLSRRVSFIASMMERKVSFRVAEMPHADSFQLHIWAAMAEAERKAISNRTKAALAAVKAKGTKLGCPLNGDRAAEALQRARELAPKLAAMEAAGIASANAQARQLNSEKVSTPNGGAWTPAAIIRVRARLAA